MRFPPLLLLSLAGLMAFLLAAGVGIAHAGPVALVPATGADLVDS